MAVVEFSSFGRVYFGVLAQKVFEMQNFPDASEVPVDVRNVFFALLQVVPSEFFQRRLEHIRVGLQHGEAAVLICGYHHLWPLYYVAVHYQY